MTQWVWLDEADDDARPLADAIVELFCPSCEGQPQLDRRAAGWSCPDCWASWDRNGQMGIRWRLGDPRW